MSRQFPSLFHRALALTGGSRTHRRGRARLRRYRRREVFAAQFAGADAFSTGFGTSQTLHAIECLEVRAMLTASSEADFVFVNGTITSYTGAGGDIVIPATIGGQTVTAIGTNAFSDQASITSVMIPAGVTSIGIQSFLNCTNLTSIGFPAGLTTIGVGAFTGCRSLRSVALPDGLMSIGSGTFALCSGLTSVTLPAGLTSIGNYAFSNCTSLATIALPSTLAAIEKMAFVYCTSLSSVILPAALSTVSEGAFSGCTGLRSIAFSSALTSIGPWAFGECASLESVVLPESLTSVGEWAFSRCVGLTSVTLPASLTAIGEAAFAFCTSLTAVTVPGNLTNVGNAVFSYCTSLTNITWPASLTSVAGGMFAECASLKSITLPFGVTSIGGSAFSRCVSLTSVTLPSSLTEIRNSAFQNCTSLVSVLLPASVITISNYAFADCPALKSVVCAGNAPSGDALTFFNSNQVTIYCLPQAAGWFGTFAGRPVIALAAPTAPSNVRPVAGYRQVTVTWAAPASNDGSPILDYVIQYSADNGKAWTTFDDGVSTAPSATVTGLDDRLPYVFRVAATNIAGAGAYSGPSVAVIPRTVPSTPTGLVAEPGNGRVVLRWAAPASDGGRPVTDYVIQFSTDNGTTWRTFADGQATATAATVTGLTNGRSYAFRVWAKSDLGLSALPAAVAGVMPRTIPSVTTSVRATSRNRIITLTWAAPTSNGGAAISDYVVQYSSNSGRTWTTFDDGVSSQRSAVIAGLTAGRLYVFRVAARNDAGLGGFSARSMAIRV